MKNDSKIGIYYPGFTRKAITFSIDDGDIPNDIKFLEIVRPAGILGTFNISSPTKTTPEQYREIYRGYEIANHCAYHPLLMVDGQEYAVSDEPYDKQTARDYTESDPVIYKSSVENIYLIVNKGVARRITDKENYFRFACENRVALEEIFGKGSVKAYVWPFRDPKDEWLYNALCGEGYTYIRGGGPFPIEEQTFNIPNDKTHWKYTARETNLLYAMNVYENYPDDGNLKIFSFGVHARDYERNDKWGDLKTFAEKYGNRPNDYYYATNADIIEYEAATKSLIITDTKIENPSNIDVYVTVDGKQSVISAHTTLEY